MNKAWRATPREVDLLSWFTGPLVPVVFGGVATALGLALVLAMDRGEPRVTLGYLAVAAMAVAFSSVIVLSPRRRVKLTVTITFLPISIGWVAMLLSIASEWGTTIPYELRWSPIALALLLASLAPYLSAARILILGTLSAVMSMAATAVSLTVEPHPTYWPPLVQVLLGSGMILVAIAASTVFCYQVVARTLRWADTSSGKLISSGVLGEAARRRILHQELASVSERALPLLKRVTASGVVTEADRDEAGVLAESLRVELVERSNLSWLESLTRQMSLTVIDHDRLAERMNLSQRSALLGLLSTATKELFDVTTRVVIELRGEIDGATAVAISADHAVPEGHKLTLLAPHYVSLVAAVDDVEWNTSEKLHMSFRVPPRGEN